MATVVAATPKGRNSRNQTGLAAAMLAPSMVILGVFVLYPLAKAIWLGHQRCDTQGKRCQSNGWDQYVGVFRSREFQHALAVTFKYVLLTVPLGLALGVGLAVLADRYIRGVGIFRTIFSSTVATSVAVASLMWFWLLQPSKGILLNIDWLVRWFPVIKRPGLLADQGTALSSVALSSVWANLGFTFIIITAGLQSIPKDLYESAFVDGASGWRRFTNVTLPMLGPTLLFVSVALMGRAFQSYGEVDLLTHGGPRGSTTTVTYLIYGTESIVRNNDGLQAAVAVLLFAVLLIISLLQFRGLDKRVHYGN